MVVTGRLTGEQAGRNAAGAGSRPWLRKDGLWCVHLSCGSARDELGELLRVRRSVYGRTAEEAERKAAELRATPTAGASRPGRELTVGELLASWLARKRSCAPGTYASYEQQVRLYLTPHLGHIRLAALTVDDVQDCIDAQAARTTVRGGPFATGTVRLVIGALRQALKYVVARRLFARNVATDARVGRPRPAAALPHHGGGGAAPGHRAGQSPRGALSRGTHPGAAARRTPRAALGERRSGRWSHRGPRAAPAAHAR